MPKLSDAKKIENAACEAFLDEGNARVILQVSAPHFQAVHIVLHATDAQSLAGQLDGSARTSRQANLGRRRTRGEPKTS